MTNPPGRPGLLKCKACRKQCTVRVGTIFEDSHIKLSSWVLAIHLMTASKKGMSAHQLHRMLGITYRSAWFLFHRLRWAMTQEPLKSKLKGIVEVNETYVGDGNDQTGRRSKGGSPKVPVFTLVERKGRARSFVPNRVTAANVEQLIDRNVAKGTEIMTDEASWYGHVGAFNQRSHQTVNHSRAGPHQHRRGLLLAAEAGHRGDVSPRQRRASPPLPLGVRLRYSLRSIPDGARAAEIVKATEGKRLRLAPPRN